MVKTPCLALILALASAAAQAERPITVDELRMLSGDADRSHREKAARIKGGDLSDMLGEPPPSAVSAAPRGGAETPSVASAPEPPSSVSERPPARASKYDAVEGAREKTAGAAGVKPRGGETPRGAATPRNAFEYVPPPRSLGESQVVTDAVTVDTHTYGIRIGTWVEADLLRDTTNAELGVAAFRVTEGVQGRYRELEVGTELFAEKQYNEATQRLELAITNGVTPEGKEFTVRGVVHDLKKVSGLHGIVKKKDVVGGGVQTGVLAAARAAVNEISGANPMSAGASAAANAVLREGEGSVREKMADEYVIYVPRQNVKIFVSQSF